MHPRMRYDAQILVEDLPAQAPVAPAEQLPLTEAPGALVLRIRVEVRVHEEVGIDREHQWRPPMRS